jgi:pullulanase
VGNDIASERKMVRKFIVDSISLWIKEYHIDGFRFDLMGILDVKTMSEVREACESLQKGTLLIGEGWNLNTPLPIEQKAIIRNQSKMPTIAQFNDKFRDTIKGSTFNIFEKGYALGNAHYYEAACEMLSGSIGFKRPENGLFNEPYQSVNYIECHDNHTMWDKLISCHHDADDFLRMSYHRLATGIVIFSQGIPFLHSGQEFFRTKQGDGNSYRSPDYINQLDWDRKCRYEENVNYIKGLIAIRKALSCFRMRSAAEIRTNMQLLSNSESIISFLYQTKDSDFNEVVVLINPFPEKHTISIPEGKWMILADHLHSGNYSKRVVTRGKVTIEPVCLNVLAKK